MLNLKNLNLVYRPFPHGFFSDILSDDIYKKLVEDFPAPINSSGRDHYGGKKYISEQLETISKYFDFILRSDVYLSLYKNIKSRKFIESLLEKLKDEGVDLGNTKYKFINFDRLSSGYFIKKQLARLKIKIFNQSYLNARFEFSYLRLDGKACLNPHTDSPNKLLSLVIPILNSEEVKEFQGLKLGTAIYDVKNDKNYFNQCNNFLKFSDVEEFNQMPFSENTMIILVKTFNSLHGVPPNLYKLEDCYRRSLTINIEIINRNQGLNML